MPICATPSLRLALFTAAFAAAATGCDESSSPTEAQPESMHLTPGQSASARTPAQAPGEKPAADNTLSTTFGAAGVGVPVGAGNPSPPPILVPVAGSFGVAGTNAHAGQVNMPRVAIRSVDTTGSGSCSGLRIDHFISKAQQLRPELTDIQLVTHLDQSPGANSVSAYVDSDGKFSLVFRRGDGDCPAGCISNEYWYIKADDNCEPQQVGYYKRHFGQNNCYEESGMAQWDEPRPLDPQYACGANLTPQNVTGSHQLRARGVIQACARSGETIAPMSIDKTITLEVAQDSAQLAQATVTVRGLGHPLIDDRKLTADVVRRRVKAHVSESNLPNKCIKQNDLDLTYDLEGLAERRLYLMEVDTPDCDNKPDDYCKGYVELSLSEP